MEQTGFLVKCYDKQELARMYFPELKASVAVNKLRRWMRRSEALMNEIRARGFHPKTKAFTAREVQIIVYYLGAPGEL